MKTANNLRDSFLEDWLDKKFHEVATNFDKRVISKDDMIILLLKEQREYIRLLELKIKELQKL